MYSLVYEFLRMLLLHLNTPFFPSDCAQNTHEVLHISLLTPESVSYCS